MIPLKYPLLWIIVFHKIYFTSSSCFDNAITTSSKGPLNLGISLERLSAYSIFSDSKYSMLKSYPRNIVAHHCNQLAECTGIPFFEPNIAKSGLWSVCRTKLLPCIILWNFLSWRLLPMPLFQFGYNFSRRQRCSWVTVLIFASFPLCRSDAQMPYCLAPEATIMSNEGSKCVSADSDINIFLFLWMPSDS